MNTEKVKVSPLYLGLIEGMHSDKLKINDEKLRGMVRSILTTTDLSTSRSFILNRRRVRTVWYTAAPASDAICADF